CHKPRLPRLPRPTARLAHTSSVHFQHGMSNAMTDETLSNLSREERRFEPPAELAKNANVKAEAYDRAAADREGFWAEQAERLDWGQRWDRVLDWDDPPFAKWFVGGTLNAAVNCVD